MHIDTCVQRRVSYRIVPWFNNPWLPNRAFHSLPHGSLGDGDSPRFSLTKYEWVFVITTEHFVGLP